jgi:hypothetical protein
MTDLPATRITGGCQCGAVRYACKRLGRATICHCRMCQKAFGNFFGPLVTARKLEWTRGEPARFASSNLVKRGFCAICGTPLTFEWGGDPEISIGSLDNPELAPPVLHLNAADKLSFVDALHLLPTRGDGEEPAVEAFKACVHSFQHPDHDTREWPMERRP